MRSGSKCSLLWWATGKSAGLSSPSTFLHSSAFYHHLSWTEAHREGWAGLKNWTDNTKEKLNENQWPSHGSKWQEPPKEHYMETNQTCSDCHILYSSGTMLVVFYPGLFLEPANIAFKGFLKIFHSLLTILFGQLCEFLPHDTFNLSRHLKERYPQNIPSFSAL